MFIDIVSPKKPLEAERLYNRCWRGGEEFTPGICMDVLRSTNYAACIKRMLACVEKLPKEEQGAFKDVVLSTFHNREQPEEVVAIGERLAKESGYFKEFEERRQKIDGEAYLLSMPAREVYPVYNGGTYDGLNLGQVKGVIFLGNTCLKNGKKMPEVMDFSRADVVDLQGVDISAIKEIKFKEGAKFYLSQAAGFNGGLDLSQCGEVCFSLLDLPDVSSIRFKDGAAVYLSSIEKMPEVLDFSDVGYVKFSFCDLREVKDIKLKEEGRLVLSSMTRFPEELDFSNCADLNVDFCSFAKVKRMKLKEGGRAEFAEVVHWPKNVDFSLCDNLRLCDCGFENGPSINFRDGAEVFIDNAAGLSGALDFSKCRNVLFQKTRIHNLTELKFASREQQVKGMADCIVPDNWEGRVVYADEEGKNQESGISKIWKRLKDLGR